MNIPCVNYYVIFSIVFFTVLLFQNVESDVAKMEPDEIKDKWIQDFKTNVETFAEKVLNITEIQKQLRTNRKNDEVKLIDELLEFNRIYRQVSIRLSDVHGVVINLKNAIENELNAHEQGMPPKALEPLPLCCSVNTDPRRYEGRLRQQVDLNKPCIGTKEGSLFRTDVWASLQHLQQNYVDTPTVLWQYFATTEGYFTQYPSSSRHCDNHGSLISPLLQEWFVDKLFMERKNIIIVYDVGENSGNVVGPNNKTASMYIHEAVLRILDTLTPDDQVNVVAFNDTAHVPKQCDGRLFTANKVNADKIRRFLSSTAIHGGGSNYTAGLLKAYNLLMSEKQYLPEKFKKLYTQLIFLTPGNPTNMDIEELFTTIASKQQALGKKVHHFVYTFDTTIGQGDRNILSEIAHQELPGWPRVSGLNITFMPPVGPRGDFHVYNATGFVHGAATYYNKLESEAVKPEPSVTIIGPKTDPHSGLIMTSTVPVFHNNSVYGVAAIDTSMATIFAEILNFDIGVHSYAFLMESKHGRVLLHPKLDAPGDILQESPVFPHLSVVEPNLNQVQVSNLTHADTETQRLRAQVSMGRSSFKSGTPFDKSTPQNATLVYSKIHGTQFILVLVKFDLDRDILIPKDLAQDLKLHAPYHRLDEIFQSPTHNKPQDTRVCSFDDNFIATQESVIKLSPSVFVDPEKYKYSKENVNKIFELNSFLEHSKNTPLIRLEIKEEIEHILRSTNEMDNLWRPTAKLVLERYFGTPTGVLRIFPGMPFRNTYNHINQLWFRKSVALPHQFVFSSGKFSRFSDRNMVLMSKAVSENIETDSQNSPLVKQLQGVVGVVISHRQLTGMLNQVAGCGESYLECHLLDNNGYLMTSNRGATASNHITQRFPWLADHLLQTRKMKPFWCTSLSEGQHRLSYTINLTFDQRIQPNKCQSYVIGSVTGTNLYLLVLYKTAKSGCETSFNETNSCVNSNNDQCHECLTNNDHCVSPCQCSADFDQCSSHYDLHGMRTTVCYNDPPVDDQIPPSFRPRPPSSDVRNCSLPCVSVEERDECLSLMHCQWGDDINDFPTCVWRNVSDIALPTSKITTPMVPTPPLKPPTKQTAVHPLPVTAGPSIIAPPKQTAVPPLFGSTLPPFVAPPKRTTTDNPHTMPVSPPTTKPPPHHPTAHSLTNFTKVPTRTSSSTSDMEQTTDTSTIAKQTVNTGSETLSTQTTPSRGSTSSKQTTNKEHLVLYTSDPPHKTTPSRQNLSLQNRKTQSTDDRTGLVVGLIVAAVVVTVIVGLVIYKVRQKLKSRSNGNYTRKGSVFDGVLFKRSSEQAELTQTSQPYQQIM